MIGETNGLQDFRAATNDPEVIAETRLQLLTPIQERRVFIIGAIDRSNGGHNLDWNWHFIPSQWTWTEAAIELCDGNAVLVDQAVDYWVDALARIRHRLPGLSLALCPPSEQIAARPHPRIGDGCGLGQFCPAQSYVTQELGRAP
jgi:hypothetical protein